MRRIKRIQKSWLVKLSCLLDCVWQDSWEQMRVSRKFLATSIHLSSSTTFLLHSLALHKFLHPTRSPVDLYVIRSRDSHLNKSRCCSCVSRPRPGIWRLWRERSSSVLRRHVLGTYFWLGLMIGVWIGRGCMKVRSKVLLAPLCMQIYIWSEERTNRWMSHLFVRHILLLKCLWYYSLFISILLLIFFMCHPNAELRNMLSSHLHIFYKHSSP